MDVILDVCDRHLLTPYVYSTSWQEDDILRQFISLFFITVIGGTLVYIIPATFSYFFIFDHKLKEHPLFLKNQVRREIIYTLNSVPFMAFITTFLFVLEVRGYSKLHDNFTNNTLGYAGVAFSVVTFLLFTDMCIYWIHRWLHHKLIYKYIHKFHHMWKVPTPFASHAFHPIDGFLQSCPYHMYAFLFPLNKFVYLAMFVFVNFWTVSIHDGDYRVPPQLEPLVNGSAHHTDHHLFYNYNYGQFFTLWDRIGGSFRTPSAFEGKGPMVEVNRVLRERHENGKTEKKQTIVEKTTCNGHGYNLRTR
ncbi:lathosterol oxidase-like [Antedon mediterranea]|uniref:lathosterol oxidase-like n=1 Tax=Antedon mediterranea TaxID=105859 RepID=UPI003AF4B10F